ncbi:HAD-IIB family hydrolase [Thiosocius teredinicola]|uniref:HAD-IIB family hydrolase n=1 Tax=Thiosocius teredinicola TaxID=1973002 RepID=UPI000990BA48
MRASDTIIFTDLDGTLLDHRDYSFDAAGPALAEVEQRAIPLILATSKTLAEVTEINRQLGNPQPVIVENGCALCFPLSRSYPFKIRTQETINGHAVVRCSTPIDSIRRFLRNQRARYDWQIEGFGDMSVEQVVEHTGLSHEQAELAKQRLCSEPFLWHDTPANLENFRALAADDGLRVTQGGRFWHLMGNSSKAKALDTMCRLYTPHDATPLTVIALGDSENDREMLEMADIAVVIKRHDDTHLDCRGKKQTIRTEQQGPAGWNQAILQLLRQ